MAVKMGKFGVVKVYRGWNMGKMAYYYADILIHKGNKQWMVPCIAVMGTSYPISWKHMKEVYSNLQWVRALSYDEKARIMELMLADNWPPIR